MFKLNYTDVTAKSGNILVGSDTATALTDEKIGGKTPYVLDKDGEGNIRFNKFTGASIPAGKAYFTE